ncbi:MAG: hypothetical protein CTY27_02660 [Methylotenera sp.]|nr:MAG: hypothetical protein CTY27_02660 [Methylotenera sp.]
MLKPFSYFVAYLLLVLMPMQALATANMLVCNSVMQSNAAKYQAENTSSAVSEIPCHQHMTTKSHHQSDSKSSCKTTCANLCALTAIPVQIQSNFALNSTQVFDFKHPIYASIPQQNLQRPPITFI